MVVWLDPDDPLQSSRDHYNSTPSFISSLGGFVNPAFSMRSGDDNGHDTQLQARSPSEGREEGLGEASASPSPSAA